jgi:hypothetical protein
MSAQRRAQFDGLPLIKRTFILPDLRQRLLADGAERGRWRDDVGIRP